MQRQFKGYVEAMQRLCISCTKAVLGHAKAVQSCEGTEQARVA